TTWLVAVNASATDAAFEVTLAGESRALQPGPLRGVVLPARRATAFDLNSFALGERALAATVRASLGRIAVSVIGVDERGLRAGIGVRVLSRTWDLPASEADSSGALGVLSGRSETPFRVRSKGAEAQDVLTDVSVPPLRAGSFAVSASGSFSAASEGPAPFATVRRLARTGVPDEAALVGAPAGARVWAAPPVGPPEAGGGSLLIQNPAGRPARATVSLLGPSGPVAASEQAIDLGPGQTQEIDLSDQTSPVSALVQAETGTVVVARSVVWAGGFATALALPVRLV
ncbi:MAG TPA: DUF5719 family protein, partial [Actinomycetota bacterium]|nr:DUF5719 family protein [Actinomycetota bacterium]